MRLSIRAPEPLSLNLTDTSAQGIIGTARSPSHTPFPPLPLHAASDPAEQQALQRRTSQRVCARLFSALLGSTSASLWKMNDAARSHLEKILGMSLAPQNAEEALALREALEREIAGLKHFGKKIQTFLDNKEQPNETIAELDIQYCPHMLAMETIRHPDLQVAHFNSTLSFVEHLREHLKNGKPLVRQALVRCGKGEDDVLHHICFDVVNKNGTLSLMGIESANFMSLHGKQAIRMINEALEGLLPQHPYKWSVIANNVQNSAVDCVMFCISDAKKAHDESPFMDGLHIKQIADLPFYDPGPEHVFFEEMENSIKEGATNMHEAIADGKDFMPLSMFKHAQSLSVIKAMEETRPEVYLPLKKANKAENDIPSERKSLYEHVKSYSKPKRVGLQMKTYNNSIEKNREKTVRKTRKLFEELRDNIPVFD